MERNLESGRKTIAGKLTGVYGVKGWIKVHSYTEPHENILMYQPWFIADVSGNISDKPISIDDHRLHGKGLVVHIKGVDNRDQAINYCQQLIAVDMGILPQLPEGDYYWEQLKGLKVVSVYGGRENAPVLLGTISDLMETGANDVLVVIPCEKSIDKRERLLPYVDAHVINVDLAAGTVIVDWDPEF